MTYFIIYVIGFFIVPIILTLADKYTNGFIIQGHEETDYFFAYTVCSLLWPIGLIIVFFSLLNYWRTN